jgi:hypothetical protein
MTSDDYDTPRTPPATPPVIDPEVDPVRAAELEGDTDEPGKTPDEIVPDEGDIHEPARPAEIEIERGGDTDEPGKVPGSPEIRMPPD